MIQNVKAAREFVKGLRSGDYPQYGGNLISYPGDYYHPVGEEKPAYCAEGVFVLTALKGRFDHRKALYTVYGVEHEDTGFLNEEALISVFGEWVPVRTWNDARGWSFEVIADTLEAMFPKIRS